MTAFAFPYLPVRSLLYSAPELFEGFLPSSPASWAETRDFAIYRHFVTEGRSAPPNPYSAMMQALHDSSITQATARSIASARIAAVMGGHKLARNSAAYRDVVVLSRELTRAGFLMCSGGGPGAMEACHLGACLATYSDADLERALGHLKTHAVVPVLNSVVAPNGSIDAAIVAQAHAWFTPAFELSQSFSPRSDSLAIPTWHYGHEPTTPFASHIAKYFQNSIREDGLLAVARYGIVYTEGKAGTIQEIFQDGAQNYYRSFGCFSPMVLLGANYWTTIYPVVAVLERLFPPADFKDRVLVTDDVPSAVAFIRSFQP